MPNYRALTLTFTCNSSARVKLFFLSLFFRYSVSSFRFCCFCCCCGGGGGCASCVVKVTHFSSGLLLLTLNWKFPQINIVSGIWRVGEFGGRGDPKESELMGTQTDHNNYQQLKKKIGGIVDR